MIWLQRARKIVGIAALPTTQLHLEADGRCKVDLRSLPIDRLIIDVDNMKPPLSNYKKGKKNCDYVVLVTDSHKNYVVFIEAKSGKYNPDRDDDNALRQLESSYKIFEQISVLYRSQLFDNSDENQCEFWAICIKKAPRASHNMRLPNRGAGIRQFNQTRVSLRYWTDDRDIWKAISPKSVN